MLKRPQINLALFSARISVGSGTYVQKAVSNGAPMRIFSTGKQKSQSLLGWYNRMLEEKPLLTKSITTASIIGAADLMCQSFIEKSEIDFKRFIIMVSLGGFQIGPVLHLWLVVTCENTLKKKKGEKYLGRITPICV